MVVSSEAFLPVAVPSLCRASPLAATRSSGGLKLGRRLSKSSLRMNLQVCALFFSRESGRRGALALMRQGALALMPPSATGGARQAKGL